MKKHINQKTTIWLGVLFENLKDSVDDDVVYLDNNLFIEKSEESNEVYYDLKTPSGQIPCMDGETCIIVGYDKNTITLKEEDENIPFKLSRMEYMLAGSLSVY